MPDDEISHDAQVTPAHVLTALAKFKDEVNGRLDTIEGNQEDLRKDLAALGDAQAELKVSFSEAGLNGHTPLLKQFLEDYAAATTQRQAWRTVWADVRRRFAFLAPGKHWVGLLLAGSLGAIGWELVSRFVSQAHIPGFP